jgi:hypothetical protein
MLRGLFLFALASLTAARPAVAADPPGGAAGRPSAPAPPPPLPWELTGTSSLAEPPSSEVAHRVEHRVLEKDGKVAIRAGFSWLARNDMRDNPGLSVDVAWHPAEALALELFSGTVFFSSLSDTADALRRSTGLLPDSQKPLARLTTGARWSFAYGKLLVEAADQVLHFDASFAAHAGALVTDVSPNVAGDLDLALQVGLGPALLIWAEGGWFASFEQRTRSSFSSGFLATIGLGLFI